jgi:hypothetical protein
LAAASVAERPMLDRRPSIDTPRPMVRSRKPSTRPSRFADRRSPALAWECPQPQAHHRGVGFNPSLGQEGDRTEPEA